MNWRDLAIGTLVAVAALLPTAHLHAAEPRKIAFVDTGNTGRSISAEVLAIRLIAKHKLSAAVISRAVDLDPFDIRPEANAARLLRDRGIDIDGHRAVQMTSNDARHADVILTMTTSHKARVIAMFPEAEAKTFTLSEYVTGTNADIADAWGKPMESYVEMIGQLDRYLPGALEKAVRANAAK